MADEVAARACVVLLDRLEARGIDTSRLLSGLGLPEATFRASRGRIPWSSFAELLERIEARLGGPEALQQLGEEHASHPVFGAFPAVARMFLRPRDLYWVSARWYGQSIVRNIECDIRALEDGRIEQTLRIPEEDVDCPQFFQLTLGALRSGTRFLDLPDAEVTMQLGPRRADYAIRLPPSLTLFQRLRRRFVLSPNAARRIIRELAVQHDELRAAWANLARANASLQAEIRERRVVEDQLRQAQKLDAVGRLAAGIAHDFNNLLTAINGYAELVLQRGDLPEGLPSDIEEIRSAATRATDLTTQLLAFSRSQALRPEILNLGEVVEGMEGLLRRLLGEEIESSLRLAPGLADVKADRSQMEQVVLNLCLNARDAMPRGGMLTLETFEVPHRSAGLCPEGRCVVLAVEDSGCGMTSEVQERMFEPFFSTKPPEKGSGLGLSVVYGIVRQSGGQIHVTSEPDKGARIEVHLPATREQRLPRSEAPPLLGVPRGTGTVLVVEDDPAVRRLVRRALDGAGYRVLEQEDGSKAAELVEAAPDDVDLLVTDVRMPHMSGPELARQVRRRRADLPVLYVSGYPEAGLARCLGARTDFLRKPFSAEALASRVQALLDGAASA